MMRVHLCVMGGTLGMLSVSSSHLLRAESSAKHWEQYLGILYLCFDIKKASYD